ncbi:phage holin family protein [Ideonella sp.]|uniref:phage holin family protein n=1 Tax=Ideonella sp. TaxID=1929293 RepID=UPI0035AF64DC
MAAPTSDDGQDGGSLTRTLQALLHELPGLVSDRVELFALELGRAASALARLVAWVVAIAILGVTAWLALWSGVVVGLVQAGWHWSLALLAVMVANLAAVAFAVTQVRGLAGRVSLPATRRHLTLARRSDPDSEPPSSPVHAHDPHATRLHDAERPLH